MNTHFKAKLLPISQQNNSLWLGMSPMGTNFGFVYSSDSLGWHCRCAESAPKADWFYTYKRLAELGSHVLSQVGDKIPHSVLAIWKGMWVMSEGGLSLWLVRMRETSPAHWQQHSWGPWPFLGLWSVHQNASSVSRRPLWFGYITGISLRPTPRKWVSSNHQRALSPSYVRFGQIYKKEKKRASGISVKQKS